MRWFVLSLVVITVLLTADRVEAICRTVTETGGSPPAIEPKQPVLIIKRQNVSIGCPSVPEFPDAAVPDASVSEDASGIAIPPPADAGVDATTCVSRFADTISMVVQPAFSTGAEGSRFALLMVTPSPPIVTLAPDNTFTDLFARTGPMTVYEDVVIEDPTLGQQCTDPKWNSGNDTGGGSGSSGGGGGCASGGSEWYDPNMPDDTVFPDAGVPSGDGGGVTIRTIGAYDVAILSVDDVAGFATWLTANSYQHRQADLDALQPYIELGWTVVAVRVNTDEAVDDGALTPLQFTYEGDEIRIPTAVSRQPEGGENLLTIYISAEGRYNVPGASVPYAIPQPGSFFLTKNELFVDLSKGPEDDPVAVRDFTDARARETETIIRETRIPVPCPTPSPPADGDDPQGCAPAEEDSQSTDNGVCNCVANGNQPWHGHLLLAIGCILIIRRRRH